MYSRSKLRIYKFPASVRKEVLSSLKIDKHGNYISMKALCSDGKIRVIGLNKIQKEVYLCGNVKVFHQHLIRGWIDTTSFADKFTNVGAIFIPYAYSENAELLPSWTIPAWSMPYRVAEIR